MREQILVTFFIDADFIAIQGKSLLKDDGYSGLNNPGEHQSPGNFLHFLHDKAYHVQTYAFIATQVKKLDYLIIPTIRH